MCPLRFLGAFLIKLNWCRNVLLNNHSHNHVGWTDVFSMKKSGSTLGLDAVLLLFFRVLIDSNNGSRISSAKNLFEVSPICCPNNVLTLKGSFHFIAMQLSQRIS